MPEVLQEYVYFDSDRPMVAPFGEDGSLMAYDLRNASARFTWFLPLAVSLLLKAFLGFQDAVVNSDGVVYMEAARMIAEGQISQSLLLYPMPAYPLLIAVVHFLVPDWIWAAKLISSMAAALITIPVYALTALLFDRRAALYAALAVALLPSLNDIAPDVIRDPCFLLLAYGSVYWMAKACMTESISGVTGAFVMAGVALLFRIESISLIFTYLLYLAGLSLFTDTRRRFAVKALMIMAVPAVAGVIGLLAVGATKQGLDRIDQLRGFAKHILTGRFLERYQTIYADLKESQRLSPLPSGELYQLARHYMPLLYLIGMLEAFLKSLFWPNAVPLWSACRRWLTADGIPLVVLTIAMHSLLVLIYFLHIDYLSSRYILFCALLALPLAGKGLVMIEDRCRQSKWPKACLAAMGIVFLLLPLYRSVDQGLGEDGVIAATGEWLSGEPELRRMEWASNDLRYFLYAGKPFNYLKEKKQAFALIRLYTEKDYEGIEDLAREEGKDLIILRSSQRESGEGARFRLFGILKQIESPQSVVTIYAAPRILKNAFGPSEESSK